MKYRRKPIVIEAYCPWRGDSPDWFKHALCRGAIRECVSGGFDIFTLEGVMHASPGDYIIQGVKGELYPCKPDIFEQTYEPVENVP